MEWFSRFGDQATEDIYNGINSKQARKKLNPLLNTVALRKLDMLETAHTLEDLKIPPSNRLEALKGDRLGDYSIRINGQYRIVFVWTEKGPSKVEILDYH